MTHFQLDHLNSRCMWVVCLIDPFLLLGFMKRFSHASFPCFGGRRSLDFQLPLTQQCLQRVLFSQNWAVRSAEMTIRASAFRSSFLSFQAYYSTTPTTSDSEVLSALPNCFRTMSPLCAVQWAMMSEYTLRPDSGCRRRDTVSRLSHRIG